MISKVMVDTALWFGSEMLFLNRDETEYDFENHGPNFILIYLQNVTKII